MEILASELFPLVEHNLPEELNQAGMGRFLWKIASH
jgi:hypothetical protein